MEDNRTYDAALVAAMRERERTEDVDGVPVVMKPIPDDNREHVLDPRVREVAARKRAMFAERAERAGGYSLANERWRPDKVTRDLTTGEVVETERLIGVGGTHRIDVFTYRAASAPACARVLVFLHGGGFTAGTERIYHNQMRFIAERSGALVVFPDYRLAPECPFPAAIEDAVATIEWVRDHAEELGADPERIMVAGDSAGGSLTCSCLLKDAGHLIRRAYLLFPSCDSSDYRTQSLYRWDEGCYPVAEEDRELAWSRIDRIRASAGATSEESVYVQGKTTLDDPLVSVVYATDEQLRAFPPITVAVSEYDYLRVAAEYFARRLHGLGNDVRLVRYCGCDHGFLDLFGFEPQAEEVCLDIADELARM
ncbi:MAG TPA: alpha/beta hydrolase [Candidatus Olsenella pullistercoris]|uniref:Alpha/beta hydrolase n=1 Tax=Candidatus Olsenella pullistercoris TaxID=2838712 RepID=A0A9D2EYM8_9ACTN|nr:alpha/beta hydrolase [Candidatus Olsenella pullistercoris]